MSKAPGYKLPSVAIYVGGPMGGEKATRSTNRFPIYKTDAGQRMATRTAQKNWDERFDAHLQPSAGYLLKILPDKRAPREKRAEYWHHSVFWDLAERESRYWDYDPDEAGDWEAVAIMRARYPKAFAIVVKTYVPLDVEFMMGCIEMALEEDRVDVDGNSVAERLVEELGLTMDMMNPAEVVEKELDDALATMKPAVVADS